MAKQLQPIDITSTPELLRLANEVRSSKRGRVLRSGDQNIAVLVPILPQTKDRSTAPRHLPSLPYPKLTLEQVAGSIPSISKSTLESTAASLEPPTYTGDIETMIRDAKEDHAQRTMARLKKL